MVFAERGGDRCRIALLENQNAVAEQEARLFGSTTRFGEWFEGRRDPREANRRERDANLSVGRYLRRRVRSVHAVLLFDLRRRERAAGKRQTESDDSGRRPEPDRPGNRVRLLLRACGIRAARARI